MFVAFEGGGAKGIVHVGALAALEERNVHFRGLAGTSAGAIVACLKAAGYSASEIVDLQEDKTLLDLVELTKGGKTRPVDLFGKGEWWKLDLLRSILIRKEDLKFLLALAVFYSIWVIFVSISTGDVENFYYTLKIVLYIYIYTIPITATAAWLAFYFIGRSGLVSLRTFKTELNRLLCRKMFPDEPGRTVRMSDFGSDKNRPLLKVVATDITTGTLRLFSSDSTIDASVPAAEAVVASICLPVIFRPWKIDECLFLDGGLVSNLPIWPFDEERALDPDALTIAVCISRTAAQWRRPSASWLIPALKTAAFGAAILNERAVDQLVMLKITTELDLMDFDASRQKIFESVQLAKKQASTQILEKIFELPDVYKFACHKMHGQLIDLLPTLRPAFNEPNNLGRVRVAVAVRHSDWSSVVKLKYTAGYETDHDEGIFLPLRGSLVGETWTVGKPQLERAPFPERLNLAGPEHERLRKKFAEDIKWILTVPIFGANPSVHSPAFVVAIDGSGELRDDDLVLEAMKFLVAEITQENFSSVAERFGGAAI